jgi:putative ABC transport system permease protein
VDVPGDPQALGGMAKPGAAAPPTPMTTGEVDAVIRSQAGVTRVVAIGEADVTMNGWANAIPFFGYRDDATWIGYVVIDGRWFSAPGEVVVPENFLTQTGTHIGDRITVYAAAQPVTLTIVGSIFDTFRCNCDGPPNIVIRGGWQTLAAADPTLSPTSWEVATNDLMSPAAVAHQIRQATSGFADASPANSAGTDQGFLLFQGVIASLGAILVLVALGGVINTVLLESRERLRETAILRAVGMTPRQVTAMVVATVVPLGAITALVGIPVGQLLQRAVIEDMGRIAIASSVPGSLTSATTLAEFALVALGGLAIAFVGAWLPARRTATLPIAPVLAAE